ncbi:MAG TPA: hemolysin III family protein [Myxococcota bacterium]|nr:hemolysin III family protein [Myxococcota bacterium]
MPPLEARLTLGPFQNPVRGALHASGAALWLAFAAHLAARPASFERTALWVGAASQAALFATSALYHSLPWPPRWKVRMQRADHAMIHVKIAGTLTALVWLAGPLPFGTSLLAAGWLWAFGAIAYKTLGPEIPEEPNIRLQLAQASLGLPAIAAFAAREPGAHALLLVGGGLLYLAGGLCFAARRPVLWPRVFSFHEVFHVLVLAGSGAHLLLFARILARVP